MLFYAFLAVASPTSDTPSLWTSGSAASGKRLRTPKTEKMAVLDGETSPSATVTRNDASIATETPAGQGDEVILPRISKSQVLARQEEERKHLRKKSERIRSSIPKKDRAGRARAAEDAAEEEKRLLEAQALERLESGIEEDETEQADNANPQLPESNEVAQRLGGRTESKAARRRRKKAEKEAESQRRVEAEQASMGPSPKYLETAAIQAQLKTKSMRIQPVMADGHCLYSAVAHQMGTTDLSSPVPASVQDLRNVTADYLMSHRDDFMPFLETVQGDEKLFKKYCDDLRNEPVWGGQVELRALAEILRTEIEVYAANLPIVKMGRQTESRPVLRVSFHRHYLGLGEHYNSVVPA